METATATGCSALVGHEKHASWLKVLAIGVLEPSLAQSIPRCQESRTFSIPEFIPEFPGMNVTHFSERE